MLLLGSADMPIESGSIQRKRPFKQSANVFFRCMRKLSYLEDILKEKTMYPRYNVENIEYLSIPNFSCIAIPMLCFCDIYMSKLKPHMKNYGYFGIGISKEVGIEKGLEPISYINPNTSYAYELSETIKRSIEIYKKEKIEDDIEKYAHYAMLSLLYKKPIHGVMYFTKGNKEIEKEMNFHDEKEWRFLANIPDSSSLLQLIVDKKYMTDSSLNKFSEIIKRYQISRFDIDYDAIKYLVVHRENDRDKLIHFILGLNATEKERYLLISKIIVYNELEGDL